MFSQLEITGVVKDSVGPVAFSNVVLQDETDAIKGGGITDDFGKFSIDLAPGKYKLTISFIGYKTVSKDLTIESSLVLDDIILEADAFALGEVVVKSQKNLIEYKADRLVFNVENNVTTSGGDAMSALNVTPGLVVQNNSIIMLGKGASRVMIDGRLIELTGSELVAYLNSIGADDIKNIEVITTPPAKYDAIGDGGLININLKKGTRNSWKNSTTLVYDQNTFGFYTLRNNFFYNKNKVRFSLNATCRLGNVRNLADLDIFYPNGPWKLEGNEKQKRDNLASRATLDYDISDNTSIGAQYSGNFNNPDSEYRNVTTIFEGDNQINSFLINNGERDKENSSNSFNIHSLTKLDTLGGSISIDADYFVYDSTVENDFVAESFSDDMEFQNIALSAINTSGQNIENYSVKIDVEHPLEFVNLSYGGKVSFIKSSSNTRYFDTFSGAPILDDDQSDNFEYNENLQAIYISASKSIAKKLSLKLGLRLENTNTEGFSQISNRTFTNDYLQLFPTLYLTYEKNEENQFIFNYGKRINRPNFTNLNPFRVYINSTSYSEGNPFLQPSFSNNFDFTFVHKKKFRTNVFFNVLNDGFGVVFAADDTNNTQIITRQNYFDEYSFGLGEVYSTNLFSWWQSTNILYLLGSDTQFDDILNAEPNNSLQLYASTRNTFSLGDSSKLQIDYTYSSPFEKGLYEIGYSSGLNIGFQQRFFNKNLQMSLLFNDVFNEAFLRDYTSVVNGIRQVYNENNSSRFFRLAVSYNFGNEKIKVAKRKFGNEDEKRRSKN